METKDQMPPFAHGNPWKKPMKMGMKEVLMPREYDPGIYMIVAVNDLTWVLWKQGA